MTESPRTSSVYSIPPGVPFVDALAAGILKETGGDAGVLAGYQVFLPTRRAVRSLRDAFLRQSGGSALLLPRLLPLGDLDEDALAIAGWEEIPGTGAAAIPPAIPGNPPSSDPYPPRPAVRRGTDHAGPGRVSGPGAGAADRSNSDRTAFV